MEAKYNLKFHYPVWSAGYYDNYVAIKTIVALPPKTAEKINTNIKDSRSILVSNNKTKLAMELDIPSAFSLSAEEKHSVLADINSLLQRTAIQIECARHHRSLHDYAEALNTVNEALTLARDTDACDADLAPLATCNLYKGHILLALNQYADAYDAYTIAATSKTSALMESEAAKEAAKRALRLRDKAAESKRLGGVYWRKSVFTKAWKGARQIGMGKGNVKIVESASSASMGLVYYIAGVVLPVTIRPGPVVRKPVIVQPGDDVKTRVVIGKG
ncbi:hypothetical protein F5Y16DRAFT_424774 [Xylariaceae sp. FL0255]|nr:hypothetical protein F5Y16DRAFT_424774 [Xylariaceae sp. FL0255]